MIPAAVHHFEDEYRKKMNLDILNNMFTSHYTDILLLTVGNDLFPFLLISAHGRNPFK